METITRFAPSPTGFLHVGNIRTAIVNWLYAKTHNGKFILRIDDTDSERSKDIYVDAIKQDIDWLGLKWDEIFFQSKRLANYEAVKNKLISANRLYPCYETQEELDIKKKTLLSRNLPPIYDRAALRLTEQQKIEFTERGIRPHWRFLIKDSPIAWHDFIRGDIKFDPTHISDPVLIRNDSSMTYTLASVTDDIDFGITDIIRGEDHISNSAIHMQIFEALGAKVPNFMHLSLLSSKEQEISKRLGGFGIGALREFGIEPMAINSFLAKIGTSDPISPYFLLSELIASFNIAKFSKAPCNYDQIELERLNAKLLHNMPYVIIKERLQNEGLRVIDENFWELIKPNILNIKDIELWWRICNTILEPVLDDYSFTISASTVLPPEPWDYSTWDTWIAKVKALTAKSGKDLFMPIRLALTGLDHGPELKLLLPILGHSKVMKRLNGIAA